MRGEPSARVVCGTVAGAICQWYVPLGVSRTFSIESATRDQFRRAFSQPASRKAQAGLGETSPSSVRVGDANGAAACSISMEVIPDRYCLYSSTSKNCTTNSRHGVIRPQFRSLRAYSGKFWCSNDRVRISCSGLKKLVESTMTLLLISTSLRKVGSSPGGSPNHQR